MVGRVKGRVNAGRSTEGKRRRVAVLFTPSQYVEVDGQALEAGVSLSRWVVSRCMSDTGPSLDVRGLVAELAAIRRDLYGIATNLNQLAHHANATQNFPDNAEAARQKVLEVVAGVEARVDGLFRQARL